VSQPKLKDRIEAYKAASDFKLMGKVPLIISVSGRSFSKITSLLEKPYDPKFAECMFSTMSQLCAEIEGVLFAYHHNDEIIIVTRNDQTLETVPWFDNKIQKICSVTSAIATMHFNKCASYLKLNLMDNPIFTSEVFIVPNISEAINTLIFSQQHNFISSIQLACFYELLKKYDKNTIKEMLSGLSVDEKIDLLNQECNIDFNNYPSAFRRGSACYKIPKIIDDNQMKTKWFVNEELPIFTREQSFLGNIFKNGADIFRKENF
jgi:tRNA(His) 5'-end guanylyltransferase